MRRRQPEEQRGIEVGDLRIDFVARQVGRGSRNIELTAREYALLEYLALNAGKVLKKSSILEKVWGYGFEGDSDPVKVFVNHLRTKLNAGGEPELIQTVRGYGYVLKEIREA